MQGFKRMPVALLLGALALSACDNATNNNSPSGSSSGGSSSGGSSSSSSGGSLPTPSSSILPNGDSITPTAARNSVFAALNPQLEQFPTFTVSQAMTEAVSPDQKTLLILTSGYNDISDFTGQNTIESNEFVFVYDISSGAAKQLQALPVPNTFAGIAFSPDGSKFYVGGGVDDEVHSFALSNGSWAESGAPIKLAHMASATDSVLGTGNGIEQPAVANGLNQFSANCVQAPVDTG